MSWKTDLQLRDIDNTQHIEATCRICGHVHYVNVPALLQQPELQFIHLDELETMTQCRKPHCHGTVRLALVHSNETQGFLGGLA